MNGSATHGCVLNRKNAVTQVNTLSRLGATSTSNILGKIRQYVHGVEVINSLNISMYGEVGRLYQQSVFDNIYSIIDQYEANLSTGQKVNETLNSLDRSGDGAQHTDAYCDRRNIGYGRRKGN